MTTTASTNPFNDDVYFGTPGVASVKWVQSAATVLVEWEGWANSEEFAILLDAGIRALAKHHGSRWLTVDAKKYSSRLHRNGVMHSGCRVP